MLLGWSDPIGYWNHSFAYSKSQQIQKGLWVPAAAITRLSNLYESFFWYAYVNEKHILNCIRRFSRVQGFESWMFDHEMSGMKMFNNSFLGIRQVRLT